MHRKSPKRFTFSRLLLILSMASLLTVSLLLLFLFNPSSSSSSSALSRRHQHPIPTADASDPPPQIREACKATRFPDSCLSALSQSPDPTPTHLILAAISASTAALATARSLSQSILDSSASDPDRSTAARNCLEHLSLSDRRLSAASAALPRVRVKDARAWAGAALLYQYDCWSALKYVNGTRRVADAMSFLTSLTALTSNALSMISAYQRFGADTARWSPPQTERDGYWGDDNDGAGDRLRSAGGALPSDLSPDVSVCKTGGCDHQTVQEAVDAAPDYGSDRFVIYIKAGTYEETVRISFEKTNLVFLGDGMGRTVITGSLNAQMAGFSTYNTATVGVSGDGFMARDLTFENTAAAGAHQVVAFRSDSDLSILESVEFSGHQDTLYARSLRQLYRSCRISGTVDFIFGNSATVFQDCLILVVPRLGSPEKGETNAVTAQGRTDPAQATGFVFHNSVVNATDEYMALYRSRAGRHKVYLGRPWKEYSRTVFVGCYLGEMVRPEGWLPWRGEFALATLFYGEFGSSGPGSNLTARVGWSSQIPAAHVAAYSVQNFIQGDEWIPSNQ